MFCEVFWEITETWNLSLCGHRLKKENPEWDFQREKNAYTVSLTVFKSQTDSGKARFPGSNVDHQSFFHSLIQRQVPNRIKHFTKEMLKFNRTKRETKTKPDQNFPGRFPRSVNRGDQRRLLYLHSVLNVKYSVKCRHSWLPRSRNNVFG